MGEENRARAKGEKVFVAPRQKGLFFAHREARLLADKREGNGVCRSG